jgi:hypothetical protein
MKLSMVFLNHKFPWKHKSLIIEGAHLGVHDLWSVMKISKLAMFHIGF